MLLSNLNHDLRGWVETDQLSVRGLLRVLSEPGFHATVLIRLQSSLWARGWSVTARCIRLVNFQLNGIDWVPGASADRGLLIRHPSGIVIGHEVRIGRNVTLLQHVTLGQSGVRARDARSQNPLLEDGVVVGAGAVVIGPITVGRDAVIAANAVVLKSVSPGDTVAGVPAVVVRSATAR